MKTVLRIVIVLALPITGACSSNANTASGEIPTSVILCEEPRPEMCSQEYRPVCATRDNGIRRVTRPCNTTELATYSNGCTACADTSVFSYRLAECPNENSRDS